MTGIYRMAELNIKVESLYERVHEYCKDYRTEGEPDFEVVISQRDIDFERSKSERNAKYEGKSSFNSSDEYLEELAVYRRISERMPYYATFMFHGSCIAVDGKAYLFSAPSGTGKSTHARLWREMLGDRAVMVNDDKPLIRVRDGKVTVFGTPYNGKHRLGSNIAVPLEAICVLERAEENSIQPMQAKEIYPKLVQQMYRPFDSIALVSSLRLLTEMTKSVSLWRLRCNMEPEAAAVSFKAMSGSEKDR